MYFLNSEFPRTPFQDNEFKHSTYLDILWRVCVSVIYFSVNSGKARHWPFLKVLKCKFLPMKILVSLLFVLKKKVLANQIFTLMP